MIKDIHIKNFRCIKDAKLSLSTGVNVVIGENDKGKTTILNLLHWIITNRPLGNDFQSDWCGDKDITSGCIKTIEGDIVTRKRGKVENSYHLNNMRPFTGFSTTVPEEIQKALNITDTNWQFQFDSPFLLSGSSTGEIARYLNKIADLDIIDKAQCNIEKIRRTASSELDHQKAKKSQLEKDLSSYAYLDDMERKIIQIEQLKEQIEIAEQKRDQILLLINKFSILQENLHKINKSLKKEEQINYLIKLEETIYELETQKDNILFFCSQIEALQKEAQVIAKTISKEPIVIGLLQLSKQTEKLEIKKRTIWRKIEELELAEEHYNFTTKSILVLERRYKREFPDVCPLCDTPKKNIKNF